MMTTHTITATASVPQPSLPKQSKFDKHDTHNNILTDSTKTNMLYVLQFCFFASLFSTLGGVSAKFNLTNDVASEYLQTRCNAAFLAVQSSLLSHNNQATTVTTTQQSTNYFTALILYVLPYFHTITLYVVSILFRVFQVFITLGLNTLGLTLSLKASHRSSSSLSTTLCTAGSFCLNSFFGWLLFNEKISLQYALGLGLIFIGIALVCIDNYENEQKLFKLSQGNGSLSIQGQFEDSDDYEEDECRDSVDLCVSDDENTPEGKS